MAKSFQKPLVYLLLAQAILLPSVALAQEFSVLPKPEPKPHPAPKS